MQSGDNNAPWDADRLYQAIALLGYPFVQQKRTPRENAGNLLINALSADETEPRIVESLPWITVHYFGEIDWDWLISEAKNRRIQNRLGLIVTFAWHGAEKLGKHDVSRELHEIAEQIKLRRLPAEDTLCHGRLTPGLRQHLLEKRSDDAKDWNIVTDFKFEDLRFWDIQPNGKSEFQRRLQAGEFEGVDRQENLRRYREEVTGKS